MQPIGKNYYIGDDDWMRCHPKGMQSTPFALYLIGA
jgi:hypothetical protein